MSKKLQIVTMSRRHQSHLMRRRRWLTGMFFSRVFSVAGLPQLSSPAMKLLGSIGRGEKPLQGCEGREVQRNRSGCECRCVRGQSPWLVFEATERRDGRLGEVQKETAINRRRSATSLIPRKVQRQATEGRRSKGSLNKSHIFRFN